MKNIDTNFTNDLDFISNYFKRLRDYSDLIKSELPNMGDLPSKKKVGKFLSTVNFSDLKNDWNITGRSHTLERLACKLTTMIEKGDSPNIYPLLNAIVNNKIKTLKSPLNGSLGKGHFRWDWSAYTLTPKEIERVKEFFDL